MKTAGLCFLTSFNRISYECTRKTTKTSRFWPLRFRGNSKSTQGQGSKLMHERFASFERKTKKFRNIGTCRIFLHAPEVKSTLFCVTPLTHSYVIANSSSKTSKKKVIMQFPKEYRGHGMCTNCWTLFDDSLQGKKDFTVTGTIRSVGVRRPGLWSFWFVSRFKKSFQANILSIFFPSFVANWIVVCSFSFSGVTPISHNSQSRQKTK